MDSLYITLGFAFFFKLLELTAIISAFLSYQRGTRLWEKISFYSSISLGIMSALFLLGGALAILPILLSILTYRLGRKVNYRRTRRPYI